MKKKKKRKKRFVFVSLSVLLPICVLLLFSAMNVFVPSGRDDGMRSAPRGDETNDVEQHR